MGNYVPMTGWDDLVASRDIGVAFSIICDRGFAVGLCTHRHAKMGHLIWMAEPFFDEFPSKDQVEAIETWRWPVFFPLGGALRRKMVDRIGRIPIPPSLARFPTMRNGGMMSQPWMKYREGHLDGLGLKTEDRNLPIVMIVNYERVREMLVSGWKPADRWRAYDRTQHVSRNAGRRPLSAESLCPSRRINIRPRTEKDNARSDPDKDHRQPDEKSRPGVQPSPKVCGIHSIRERGVGDPTKIALAQGR
jgi:hypothetical protein